MVSVRRDLFICFCSSSHVYMREEDMLFVRRKLAVEPTLWQEVHEAHFLLISDFISPELTRTAIIGTVKCIQPRKR